MAKDKKVTAEEVNRDAAIVEYDFLERVKAVLLRASDPELYNSALVQTSSMHPLGLRVRTKELADLADPLLREVEALLAGKAGGA